MVPAAAKAWTAVVHDGRTLRKPPTNPVAFSTIKGRELQFFFTQHIRGNEGAADERIVGPLVEHTIARSPPPDSRAYLEPSALRLVHLGCDDTPDVLRPRRRPAGFLPELLGRVPATHDRRDGEIWGNGGERERGRGVERNVSKEARRGRDGRKTIETTL